jgi:hypothetical protein
MERKPSEIPAISQPTEIIQEREQRDALWERSRAAQSDFLSERLSAGDWPTLHQPLLPPRVRTDYPNFERHDIGARAVDP